MKFIRLTCLIVLIGLVSNGHLVAQESQHTVSGTVTDQRDGNTLPGVNIQIKGTTSGTTTSQDGRYELTVPSPNDTLVFSFIGYQRYEVPVNGESEINVALVSQAVIGEELVVTGYGLQQKAEITGSVKVVDLEDIEDVPTHSPLKALQGRVAGLHITRDGTPGGGTQTVLIRGMNTLGENEPLYVIDGIPANRQKMDQLNPSDIESMQVLKDAAAASIYGSRASNGVIIISTKKGDVDGLRIDVSSSVAFEDYYKHLDLLNTEQRGEVLWRASVNDGQDPNEHAHYNYDWHSDNGTPVLDNLGVVEWLDQNTQGGIRSADTDWHDVISRQGYLTRNNVSLQSGSDSHNLLVSLGHHYNQGIVKYTDYERTSLRVNSSFNFFDNRLRIGENLQLTNGIQTPMADGIGGSPIALANGNTLPILPVYAEDGSFAGPVGSGFSDRMNPLLTADLGKDWKDDVSSADGNVFLEYNLLDNLAFNSNFGLSFTEDIRTRIEPRYSSGFLSRNINSLEEASRNTLEWTWFNTLEYSFDLGDHSTDVLAGIEATKSDFDFMRYIQEDFLVETDNYWEIDAGTGTSNIQGNGTGYRLLSYFSKVNYSYNSKYLASATLRYDGSSRFGEGERFGFFPAFSVGWRLSNEDFFADNIGFISNLMLRLGMGTTGNQQIDNDAAYAKFISGYGRAQFLCCGTTGKPTGSAYDLNGAGSGTLPSGVIQTQLANRNLRWESTDEVNIGLNVDFLDGRIAGEFDYFWRETSDILVLPPRLAALGEGTDRWENGATMENRGWEVSLNYNDQVNQDFAFLIGASVGSFKDKVTFLPEAVVRSYPGNVEQTIIGQPISSYFGYVTDGIFQNEQELNAHADQIGKDVGRLRYKDLNGDGEINSLDQTWLGHQLPDFEYGLQGNFTYKNFRLSFFLSGVQGVNLYNGRKNLDFVGAWSGQNYTTRTLEAWTPEDPNSDIPALSLTDSNNETRLSNYQIENMSYLKLKDLQLSYTLPSEVQELLGMRQARVYISGTELFTVTSKEFTGVDPENPSDFYPIPRTFTMGFDVSF